MHFQNTKYAGTHDTYTWTLAFDEVRLSLQKYRNSVFLQKKKMPHEKLPKLFYSPDQILMNFNFSVTEKNVLFFFPPADQTY